jgi:hydrophobic/amphiphilic exporter-1 (mainly G- bacteria), HAE1 family
MRLPYITIPIAMLIVFVVSAVLGRSLNIISLAALGFASGMVVDNAFLLAAVGWALGC